MDPIVLNTIKIVCYKISTELNLTLLASYFDAPYKKRNSNFILLKDKAISSIIKVHSKSKFIFLYEYGCMVFVGFSSDEIYSVLGYFETILEVVDYKLISQYNETLVLSINDCHQITMINDFVCELAYAEDILSIACGLISKSTALSATEKEITTILDEAEVIVNYLQKAKLRINTKKFVSSISHMARFQYRAVKSLDLFDSTFSLNRNASNKNFYSIVYHYYEIAERTTILESKIDEVNRLISSYTTLCYNKEEIRLLLFECVLLSMFLLPHIIDFKAFFKSLFRL